VRGVKVRILRSVVSGALDFKFGSGHVGLNWLGCKLDYESGGFVSNCTIKTYSISISSSFA
jgi:hypothetical protein